MNAVHLVIAAAVLSAACFAECSAQGVQPGTQPASGHQPPSRASQASPVPPAAADQSLGMGLLSAVMAANGALVRGVGVESTLKFGGLFGQYEVLFDRDVSMCTFTATIGAVANSPSIPAGGFVSVAGRDGNVSGVFIITRNPAGAAADLPFHLQVFCAR